MGKGVTKALQSIEKILEPKLRGMDAFDQNAVDSAMIALDGTKDKSRLGANALLGVSMAVARAAASEMGSTVVSLYRWGECS